LFLEKHRRPTPAKSPPLRLKPHRPIANDHGSMPREGAIIFSDLIDKLVVLRIECPKCDRPGQYQLADPIMRHGLNQKLFAFTDDVIANCIRQGQCL
jgi:hypothetical protein